MTPSNQVTAGSSGLILNAAHLTVAGADRVPALAARYVGRRWVSHRIQFTGAYEANLIPGPGVDVGLRAAFGRSRNQDGLPETPTGYLDLRRIDPADATPFAVAGQGDGPVSDGVLVVVTVDGVRLLPPAADPAALPEHLERELGDTAPARPVVDLLHSLAAPMLADGRRINMVSAPLDLAVAAAEQWCGPAGAAALRERSAAFAARYPDGDDIDDQAASDAYLGSSAPTPVAYIGGLLIVPLGTGDQVQICSSKGPLLNDRQWVDSFPVLAANAAWTGPLDDGAQQTYAKLRDQGLSGEDAVSVLPDLLSN